MIRPSTPEWSLASASSRLAVISMAFVPCATRSGAGGQPLDSGDQALAWFTLSELEARGGPRLDAVDERGVGEREVHRHRGPLQRRDLAVRDGHGAGGSIDRVEGSFRLVDRAGARLCTPGSRIVARLPVAAVGEVGQRGPELAFGVDEEVRRHDDAVSRLDPFEHLDVVDSALAQPHGARLEATLRERKQDDLTLTVVNDRGSRYGCSRCGAAGLELDLREHPRLEQALAVVELETNGCAARGRVQRRIAVSDFGFESPTRKGVERHQRRLTD